MWESALSLFIGYCREIILLPSFFLLAIFLIGGAYLYAILLGIFIAFIFFFGEKIITKTYNKNKKIEK